MSAKVKPTETVSPPPSDQAASAASPRKLKILMLHGFTQTGSLFHSRTKALEKHLKRAFPATTSTASTTPLKAYPGGIELLYPTGPIRLLPSDIPGFDPSKEVEGAAATEEREAYGWWKTETGSTEYIGFTEGLKTIAECIKTSGPIDGVIGFSQGAAAATFVASLLEPNRKEAFEKFEALDGKGEGEGEEERKGIKFPEGWGQELNPPLRFCVSYSGFLATNQELRAFYEPKIKTPVLNFIGKADVIVEESRCLALAEVCENGRVAYHPGGHFLPVNKEWPGVLADYIKEICADHPAVEG